MRLVGILVAVLLNCSCAMAAQRGGNVRLFSGADSSTMAAWKEKKLIRHILKGYDKQSRPINDGETPQVLDFWHQTHHQILVEFGLSLIQILELDEMAQVLTSIVRTKYRWKDPNLKWNPLHFSNITHVNVPPERIWIPDISIYNYADERMEERRHSDVMVKHDGTVEWHPMGIFRSTCPVKIKYFPFDQQCCKMKFGPWAYDGFNVNITFYDNIKKLDMSDYEESSEWKLDDSDAVRNDAIYEYLGTVYVDISFYILMTRNHAYYDYVLILPCFLLSSLTLVVFWLPAESPAKMVLGMNTFIAFFLLLLLLKKSIPSASNSFPLIGTYYSVNMILITLSTYLCLIIVNLHFRGDNRKEVPYWMKKLFIVHGSRILGVNLGQARKSIRAQVQNRRTLANSGDGDGGDGNEIKAWSAAAAAIKKRNTNMNMSNNSVSSSNSSLLMMKFQSLTASAVDQQWLPINKAPLNQQHQQQSKHPNGTLNNTACNTHSHHHHQSQQHPPATQQSNISRLVKCHSTSTTMSSCSSSSGSSERSIITCSSQSMSDLSCASDDDNNSDSDGDSNKSCQSYDTMYCKQNGNHSMETPNCKSRSRQKRATGAATVGQRDEINSYEATLEKFLDQCLPRPRTPPIAHPSTSLNIDKQRNPSGNPDISDPSQPPPLPPRPDSTVRSRAQIMSKQQHHQNPPASAPAIPTNGHFYAQSFSKQNAKKLSLRNHHHHHQQHRHALAKKQQKPGPDNTLSEMRKFRNSNRRLQLVTKDVADMINDIRYIQGVAEKRDAVQRIVTEWRLLSMVLDRLFFVIFVITIGLSLIFVFPRAKVSEYKPSTLVKQCGD